MPGWISQLSQLLGLAQVPVGAALLFGACKGLGHWLEREADDQWHHAAQQYLRSGKWFSDAVGTLLALRILFARIYGERYFSLITLWRCMIITIFVSMVFFVMGTVFNFLRLESLSLVTDDRLQMVFEDLAYNYVPRLLVAIPLDYLSVIRVRAILGRVARSSRPALVIPLSFLSDIVFLILLLTLIESIFATFRYVGHPRTMDFVLTFEGMFGDLISGYWGSEGLVDWMWLGGADTALTYAALVPSLIFYLYCLSVLVAKVVGKLAPLVTRTSEHLRFRKPFQTIFTVGGGMLAGFWILGALVVEYL